MEGTRSQTARHAWRGRLAGWAFALALAGCEDPFNVDGPVEEQRAPEEDPRSRGGDRVWHEFWVPQRNPVRDNGPGTALVEQWLDPRPGLHLADLGAGGGYFTFRLATRVLPGGTVVATDIDRRMTQAIAWEVGHRGLSNVRVMRSSQRDLALSGRCLDGALAYDVPLFRTCEPELIPRVAAQLASAIRAGGRFVWVAEVPNAERQRGCALPDLGQLEAYLRGDFDLVERRDLALPGWRGLAALFQRRASPAASRRCDDG